jgi:hypothetical protein
MMVPLIGAEGWPRSFGLCHWCRIVEAATIGGPVRQEVFKLWKPITDVPRSWNWRGLGDSPSGLVVELEDGDDPSRVLRISFGITEAYRACDESKRLKTLKAIGEQHPNLRGYTFFIIENSEFLEWFHGESLGIWIERPITHYQVCTSGDIIDVLSEVEPTVEWI